MVFRLPFHLVLEKDSMETIEEIKKNTNPKLRDNLIINRCIKFTNYVIREAKSDLVFKIKLEKRLGTDDFTKFFFRGGTK